MIPVHNLSIPCPACEKSTAINLGNLATIRGLFALTDPGNLFNCQTCNFYFRYPYLKSTELIESYKEVASGTWAKSRLARVDQPLVIKELCATLPHGRVLDVGCGNGELLSLLPEYYQKFGIEPSGPNSAAAAQCGISIIGKTLDDCLNTKFLFDAIIMVDVLEHIESPVDFLKKAFALLHPGGILIASTGNADSWLWRLMRLDYWYYLPEHVSFFSRKWFLWFAQNHGKQIIKMRFFPHFAGSICKILRQVVDCVVYLILKASKPLPMLNKMLRFIFPFSRAYLWTHPPVAHFISDHMLVVIKNHQKTNLQKALHG